MFELVLAVIHTPPSHCLPTLPHTGAHAVMFGAGVGWGYNIYGGNPLGNTGSELDPGLYHVSLHRLQ